MFLITAALAQSVDELPDFNANLFRPSIDNPWMLMVDESGLGPTHYKSSRALTSYAHRPLIYTTADGEVIEVVGGVVQEDALVAYTLGRVRVGTSIPAILYTRGELEDSRGRGDWNGDVKVTVLDPGKRWLGLAVSGRLTAPTGVVPTLSSPWFAWEAQLIADHRFGDWLVVGNVGWQGLPATDLGQVHVDDRVVVRGGVGYVGLEQAGVSLEGVGSLPLGELTALSVPAELMLSGWVDLGERFNMRAGVGPGLTRAPGTPQVRAVWVIAYEPPRVGDADRDDRLDDVDACPEEPEDLDGFRDEDGCPEPTSVQLHFTDSEGFLVPAVTAMVQGEPLPPEGGVLEAGRYEVVVQHPGFAVYEGILDVPEGPPVTLDLHLEALAPGQLTVTIQDTEGNSVPGAFWALDGEHRGGPRSLDVDAGERHVAAFADGYAPASQLVTVQPEGVHSVAFQLKPTTARLTAERIELGDSIFFETESAVIKPESYALLDDVAAILQANPKVRVRVEGHTDERGEAEFNLTLSERRAAAVMDYLVAEGVDARRLESAGYGESRPLQDASTPEAWALNRRVDFVVLE